MVKLRQGKILVWILLASATACQTDQSQSTRFRRQKSCHTGIDLASRPTTLAICGTPSSVYLYLWYAHFQWRVWCSRHNVQPAEYVWVHSEAKTAFYTSQTHNHHANIISLTNSVPTLLVTKISSTFPGLSRNPEAVFQDPVICQQCLNTKTNSSYYGVQGRTPAASYFFEYTYKI